MKWQPKHTLNKLTVLLLEPEEAVVAFLLEVPKKKLRSVFNDDQLCFKPSVEIRMVGRVEALINGATVDTTINDASSGNRDQPRMARKEFQLKLRDMKNSLLDAYRVDGS